MRQKVFQEDTSKDGDCLRACIASMFGLRVYFVPNFMKSPDGWRKCFVDYMRSKNIGVISFPIGTTQARTAFRKSNRFVSFQCVLSVESFKYPDQHHTVVGRVTDGEIEVIFDPNRENAGKVTEDYTIQEIFVFFRSF